MIFVINRNLTVSVKIVRLSCCVNKTVWTFTSNGMCTGEQRIRIHYIYLRGLLTIRPMDYFVVSLAVRTGVWGIVTELSKNDNCVINTML